MIFALPAEVQASSSAARAARVFSTFFAAIHHACKFQKVLSIVMSALQG